jgi:hypothetical protein
LLLELMRVQFLHLDPHLLPEHLPLVLLQQEPTPQAH